MENADFADRVALVTGAWRGLGRAAAARLHERGAAVAVNVRDRERAEALAKEIGERAFAVPGDIAAEGVPDEIARRTFERFGRIDILVNNAALPLSTRFPDLTAEEWRRAIEVNLTAPFLMTKAVLPAMRAQDYGRIINISSSGRPDGEHARRCALHGIEGRTPRADARGCEGARQVRHHRERRLSRYDRYRADARTCLGRIARAPRRELSRAAPRHRARSRRFDLLRRLRGCRIHYPRVFRHQRRRLDDVIYVVCQRG